MSDYGRIILSDPVNMAHPLNRGLVAWWLALPQWSGGVTWFDLMRRNNGTLTNGPAWRPASRPGGFGELSFDGSDDRVPAGQPHQLTDNFAMSCWLNPAALPQNQGIVVYNGDDSGGYGIAVGVNGSNSKIGALFGGVVWFDSGSTLSTAGQWYHAVLVRSAGTAIFYVNGVQSPTTDNSHAPLTPTAGNFEIGHEPGQAGRFFSGRIDDLRIFNRALPAAEVAALYDLGRRGYPGVLRRMRPAWSVPAAAVATVTPETIVIPARKTTCVIRERKTTLTIPARKTTIVIPERV